MKWLWVLPCLPWVGVIAHYFYVTRKEGRAVFPGRAPADDEERQR